MVHERVPARGITPAVRPTKGSDSALLVRGRDRFGHFEHETRPESDFAPGAIRRFLRAARARERYLLVSMLGR